MIGTVSCFSVLTPLLLWPAGPQGTEAQTFSNFFRFPMIFLCGLFFPIKQLPAWLRPLSYVLPLTYGADVLHASIHRPSHMPLTLDFGLLAAFCALVFGVSLRNIRRKWIT